VSTLQLGGFGNREALAGQQPVHSVPPSRGGTPAATLAPFLACRKPGQPFFCSVRFAARSRPQPPDHPVAKHDTIDWPTQSADRPSMAPS
jgi:hypothetical protein